VPRFSAGAQSAWIFRRIGCHLIVGAARRTQPLDQRGQPARRDRTCHFIIGHAGAHPAQHAADAHRDLLVFFGDRNDMALRFAFEAKSWPGIVQ